MISVDFKYLIPTIIFPFDLQFISFQKESKKGAKEKEQEQESLLIPKGKREFKTIQITSLTSLVAASIPMIPASRDTITGVRDPNLRPIWIIKQD